MSSHFKKILNYNLFQANLKHSNLIKTISIKKQWFKYFCICVREILQNILYKLICKNNIRDLISIYVDIWSSPIVSTLYNKIKL